MVQVKRVGVVGGLGSDTSGVVCMRISQKFFKHVPSQPSIILENIPVPNEVLKETIDVAPPEGMFELIKEAVVNLNRNLVDFIIIPCNTVHVFIDRLRVLSRVPVLSIMEEVAKHCELSGIQKVGLLGTTTTIQRNLFLPELRKRNIELIAPSLSEQVELNGVIANILFYRSTNADRATLMRVATSLKEKGAEAIILGCTDLQHLVSGEIGGLKFIDTCDVLENAVVDRLISN